MDSTRKCWAPPHLNVGNVLLDHMKATGNELTVTTNHMCGNSFQYLLVAQQFVIVVTKEGSKHANQCFASQSY